MAGVLWVHQDSPKQLWPLQYKCGATPKVGHMMPLNALYRKSFLIRTRRSKDAFAKMKRTVVPTCRTKVMRGVRWKKALAGGSLLFNVRAAGIIAALTEILSTSTQTSAPLPMMHWQRSYRIGSRWHCCCQVHTWHSVSELGLNPAVASQLQGQASWRLRSVSQERQWRR